MTLRMPESMDECIYFTRRKFDTNDGKIIAWVYRKDCPQCGEKMGKPIDDKTGKAKVRAEACSGCGLCVITCPSQAIRLVPRI